MMEYGMLRRVHTGHHAAHSSAVVPSSSARDSLERLLLFGPRPRPPLGGPYHPNAVHKKEVEVQERLHRVRRLLHIRQAQKDVQLMERRLETSRVSLVNMQRDAGVEGTRALEQFKSPAAPVLPAFLERRRQELLLAKRAALSNVDTVNVVTVRTASSREVSTTSITMTSRPRPSTSSSSSSSRHASRSSAAAAALPLLSRRQSRALADSKVRVRVMSATSSSGKSSGSSSRKPSSRRLPPPPDVSPLFLWDTRDAVSKTTLTATSPEPTTPYYDSESTFPHETTLLPMTSNESPLDTLPQPLSLRLPNRARLAGCRSPASPSR